MGPRLRLDAVPGKVEEEQVVRREQRRQVVQGIHHVDMVRLAPPAGGQRADLIEPARLGQAPPHLFGVAGRERQVRDFRIE